MHYDVIIVGAGAAGCVLAARLSENLDRSVLLLEAGPDYPSVETLPAEIASGHHPAFSHDWGYFSEPNGGDRAIHLPRGRLVGGCSATNATIAVRGATPGDYDEWATMGNPGWSFTEVLPFFRRLEDDLDCRDEWHGQNGPLPIRRASGEGLNDTQRRFLEACQAAGHPFIADHNAPGAVGVGPWPTNTVAGIRQSAALTYLMPARARPNLTIRSNALVNRVIFEGRRAVGLQLASPRETILAERVILASGAYGSPAILLRSGLGPAEALRSLDIPVLEDRPGVGQNLSDHPLVGLRLATSSPAEAGPSFQVVLTSNSAPAGPGHDLQVFASSRMSGDGATMFYLFASLLKPLSWGWLGLRSTDSSVAPCIDPGYFSQSADLPRMIVAVRLARRLAQMPPLSHLVLDEVFPGASIGDTDIDLATVIRAGVESYHHPVGTCRMGPVHETTAVVDQHGAVHGVDGLWVIDASIMPTIPAGNTHLPTLMVAERCVAWLVEG